MKQWLPWDEWTARPFGLIGHPNGGEPPRNAYSDLEWEALPERPGSRTTGKAGSDSSGVDADLFTEVVNAIRSERVNGGRERALF